MGAIADRVRGIIPETIAEMTNSSRYTPADLQTTVDVVKWNLFATICNTTAETSLYPIPVIDHVAKVTAIQIIPAAVDFWNNQIVSQAAGSGVDQQNTWNDRRKAMWDVLRRLETEVSRFGVSIDANGGIVLERRGRSTTPLVSTSQPNAITPDPLSFSREYASPGIPMRLVPDWTLAP